MDRSTKYAVIRSEIARSGLKNEDRIVAKICENDCSYLVGWPFIATGGEHKLLDPEHRDREPTYCLYYFSRGTYQWDLYDTLEELKQNHFELFV